MSNGLLRWAFSVKADRSTDKCLLICLANRVRDDSEGICFPSQAQIVDDSCQDRKTVIAGLRRLSEAGLILDTGARVGTTRQIIVWKIGPTVPVAASLEPDAGAVEAKALAPAEPPKKGPLCEDGKIGIVPLLDNNGPVFPVKGSRFSRQGSRKRDTEPKEPKGNPKKLIKEARAKPPAVVIPDWIPSEAWNGYLAMREAGKRKPTSHAVELLIQRLGRFREDGLSLATILDTSTRNGWTDVYAPRDRTKIQTRGNPRDGVRASYAVMFDSE